MTRLSLLAALILLACLGLALIGCARDQNKQVDPAAFTLWVVPW